MPRTTNPFLANPFAAPVKKKKAQVRKAQNALPSRSDLPAKLNGDGGVTSTEYKYLTANSNEHDRKLLKTYASNAAKTWSKAYTKAEANRKKQQKDLIRHGVSKQDAAYLTGPVRARPIGPGDHRPGDTSLLGLATINTHDLGDELARHAGPTATAFVNRIPSYLARAGEGAGIVAEETAKHPVKTATGLAEMGFGGLAGAAELVPKEISAAAHGHPLTPIQELGKAYLSDLAERYGPLAHGDTKAFRDRLEKEGTAAELLDAAGVASVGGVTAGRTLGALARAGKLGARAEELTTAARPALRAAGGTAKDQELSRNLLTVLGQRALDARRAAKTSKKAIDAGHLQGADALAHAAHEAGDVVPLNPRTPVRQVARQEGVARLEHKHHLADELKTYRQLIKNLNKKEKSAFKYAVQYGLRTPEHAESHLPTLLDEIEDTRRELGTPKHNDEVPQLMRILADPEAHFTPRLAEAAEHARQLGERLGELDPTLRNDSARIRAGRAQAALLGKGHDVPVPEAAPGDVPEMRYSGDPDEFLADLDALRQEHGLAPGGYFPSKKYGLTDYGAYTRGSALRGPGRHRQYTGVLRSAGAEHGGADVLEQALARNLRNYHQLDAVTRTIMQQALPWSTAAAGRAPSFTPAQLHERSLERGIDPKTWVAVSPRALNEGLRQIVGPRTEFEVGRDDLARASVAGPDAQYRSTPGFVAVPRDDYDEFAKNLQPTGKPTRIYGKAKGAWSRAMLGFSPTWLPFQVAGNALQTGLAGALPGDSRYLRDALEQLNPTEQRRVKAHLGIGQGNERYNEQRLGSLAGDWANRWNEWRTTTKTGKAAGYANVPKGMFKLDELQNNAFRKTAAGAKLKRMVKEANRGVDTMDQLAKKDGAAVLRDPKQLEQLADHVHKFLGDFTSYTHAERMASRGIMFYGWLRFSLGLLFKTMPTNRPIVGSIVGQLGKLHADEIQQIFGDDAPPWLYTYAILGGSKDAPIGINTARLIPFMNAVSDPGTAENPFAAAIGVIPPPLQGVADAAFGKNLFTGHETKATGGASDNGGWGGSSSRPTLTTGDRMRQYLSTAIGTPLAPIRIEQRLANPKAYEEDDPLWLRALRQTTPAPGPIPYTANGEGGSTGGWG